MFDTGNPLWWVSSAFALLALVFFAWGWTLRNKVKIMIFVGLGSTALAISVPILGDVSLSVLFGLAAIRNFLFAYLDWRSAKGKVVAKWLPYFLAGVFVVLTIAATVIFLTLPSLQKYIAFDGKGWWLEILICVTLIGLIIGNILQGTKLMRTSFMLNRGFNIISHIYFGNVFAIVTDAASILSNIGYYARVLDAKMGKRKIEKDASRLTLQPPSLVTPPSDLCACGSLQNVCQCIVQG